MDLSRHKCLAVSDDRTDIDKLIKGDHSDFPLLLLYDDIIEMYPDKKAEEDKEED